MKRIAFNITVILSLLTGIYLQYTQPNNVMAIGMCMIIFMIGVMRLSSKIKSKNIENQEEND